MPDLETKIRELAARGDITHISLTPDGKRWRATYAPASVYGVVHSTDDDPVKAILRALDEPKLKSRKPKDVGLNEPGPDSADIADMTRQAAEDDDLGIGP